MSAACRCGLCTRRLGSPPRARKNAHNFLKPTWVRAACVCTPFDGSTQSRLKYGHGGVARGAELRSASARRSEAKHRRRRRGARTQQSTRQPCKRCVVTVLGGSRGQGTRHGIPTDGPKRLPDFGLSGLPLATARPKPIHTQSSSVRPPGPARDGGGHRKRKRTTSTVNKSVCAA